MLTTYIASRPLRFKPPGKPPVSYAPGEPVPEFESFSAITRERLLSQAYVARAHADDGLSPAELAELREMLAQRRQLRGAKMGSFSDLEPQQSALEAVTEAPEPVLDDLDVSSFLPPGLDAAKKQAAKAKR